MYLVDSRRGYKINNKEVQYHYQILLTYLYLAYSTLSASIIP